MSDLLHQLEVEWTTIDRRPDAIAFAAAVKAHPVLATPSPTALLDRLHGSGRADRTEVDDALRALLELRAHRPTSTVAQRIVLQILIPGMRGILTRIEARPRTLTYNDDVADIVSATAERIATYPLETRPSSVFFGILRDVERDWHRANDRYQRAITLSGGALDDAVSRSWALRTLTDDPGYEHVDVRQDLTSALARAYRARAIRARDLEMIYATKFRHEDVEEVAARHGLGYDTGRRTILRAEARLAPFCASYAPRRPVAA